MRPTQQTVGVALSLLFLSRRALNLTSRPGWTLCLFAVLYLISLLLHKPLTCDSWLQSIAFFCKSLSKRVTLLLQMEEVIEIMKLLCYEMMDLGKAQAAAGGSSSRTVAIKEQLTQHADRLVRIMAGRTKQVRNASSLGFLLFYNSLKHFKLMEGTALHHAQVVMPDG